MYSTWATIICTVDRKQSIHPSNRNKPRPKAFPAHLIRTLSHFLQPGLLSKGGSRDRVMGVYTQGRGNSSVVFSSMHYPNSTWCKRQRKINVASPAPQLSRFVFLHCVAESGSDRGVLSKRQCHNRISMRRMMLWLRKVCNASAG